MAHRDIKSKDNIVIIELWDLRRLTPVSWTRPEPGGTGLTGSRRSKQTRCGEEPAGTQTVPRTIRFFCLQAGNLFCSFILQSSFIQSRGFYSETSRGVNTKLWFWPGKRWLGLESVPLHVYSKMYAWRFFLLCGKIKAVKVYLFEFNCDSQF